MSPAQQDRARQALEQIAYSDDPSIPVSARTQALGELSRMPAAGSSVEQLSPEQVREELESLAAAVPGMLAVAKGPEHVEPPTDEAELRETLDLAMRVNELLELRVAELERALAYEHRHRLLPSAPVAP